MTPEPTPKATLAAVDYKVRQLIGDRSASRCDRCGKHIQAVGQKCRASRSWFHAPMCESHFLAKSLCLADVLLAIVRSPLTKSEVDPAVFRLIQGGGWLLDRDSLDHQHSTTIDFLHALLCD